MENDKLLKKIAEEVKEIRTEGLLLQLVMAELKDIKSDIATIKDDVSDMKSRRYKCREASDNRYIRREEFADRFRNAMETYADTKIEKASSRLNLFQTIFQLTTQLAPVIAMIVGYFAIVSKIGGAA